MAKLLDDWPQGVPESRVQEVAEVLSGSTLSLDEVTTEAERDSMAFLTALDAEVMLCDTCGWWCDADEIDEDGNCEDCHDE